MKERDLLPAWPFLSFDPSINTLDENENENEMGKKTDNELL